MVLCCPPFPGNRGPRVEPSSRKDPSADTPSWNTTCPFPPFLPVPEPGWTRARVSAVPGSVSCRITPSSPQGSLQRGSSLPCSRQEWGIMDEGKRLWMWAVDSRKTFGTGALLGVKPGWWLGPQGGGEWGCVQVVAMSGTAPCDVFIHDLDEGDRGHLGLWMTPAWVGY